MDLEYGKYPTAETFFSVQGEGVHFGRSAYFLRLAGCPVKCPWCDTKYAWEASKAELCDALSLATAVEKSGAKVAVITGGEPCMYDLTPLISELKKRGIAAHIETSGVCGAPKGGADWVALSPKLFSLPASDALETADELKCIVSSADEISAYEEIARHATNAKAVWLNPEWSRHEDKSVLSAIIEFVKSHGGVFRAGWQLHKNYSVR